MLALEDVLLITQRAEKLLYSSEYAVPSAQTMQLVSSSSCSAYDCEFVALAQYLGGGFGYEGFSRVSRGVAVSLKMFLSDGKINK